MCKATGADTGAVQTHEFTPGVSEGNEVVSGIAVTDPDCSEQVVFEKLYEMEDGTPYLVASHEDINDAAQTFGGEKSAKKKKKKEAPAPEKKEAPAPNGPIAAAKSDAEGGDAAPAAPGGVGGGAPAAPAPRQVINSVPTGNTGSFGKDIFNK